MLVLVILDEDDLLGGLDVTAKEFNKLNSLEIDILLVVSST